MAYLDGKRAKPQTSKEAKLLIGKKVKYLLHRDVDYRRGICFPKQGIITDVKGRNIMLNESDWIYISDIYEMVLVE